MKNWRYPSLKHVRNQYTMARQVSLFPIQSKYAMPLYIVLQCFLYKNYNVSYRKYSVSYRNYSVSFRNYSVSFRKYKEDFIVEHMLNFELAELLIIVTLRYIVILFYFCVLLKGKLITDVIESVLSSIDIIFDRIPYIMSMLDSTLSITIITSVKLIDLIEYLGLVLMKGFRNFTYKGWIYRIIFKGLREAG